jgi:hypothetical protein
VSERRERERESRRAGEVEDWRLTEDKGKEEDSEEVRRDQNTVASCSVTTHRDFLFLICIET